MTGDVERPESVAGILHWCADHQDLMDRLLHNVTAAVAERDGGLVYEPGGSVQSDLRSLANWLDGHPDTDREMLATLPVNDVHTPTDEGPEA